MNNEKNMEDFDSLPNDYEPFVKLTFCNNLIIQGIAPIKVGDNMPLLIGRGVVPIVWLYVPVTKDRMKWRYIVERNVSHSEKVFVKISKELNSVNISIELSEGLQELVSVKMISNEEAVVDKLDLNPIGFKIRGDNNGLHIGEQFFTGNIFEGVYSMVAIGD